LTSRVLVLALSTGHKVGLAVVGAAFIAFALGSAMLIPRFRPEFPGRGGLPAFIVIVFVFFIGMLTAVEVFGAEPKEHGTETAAAPTTQQATTALTTSATTTATAVPTTAKPASQTIQVTESEFKIVLSSNSLRPGPVTFEVKNAGHIPHDLAIVGGSKTKLIPAGGSATLTTTLKSGQLELYCSVPGHKAAGMDLKLNVSGSAPATTTAKPKPKSQTIPVTESEFKIVVPSTSLKAGPVTFEVKNAGHIPHDLAIVGGPKTKLIQPGGSAALTTTLKAGTVELYCSVPGHKAAGMDLKVKAS
jgi:uncharacterized cupredoxin-like copper-binding protein